MEDCATPTVPEEIICYIHGLSPVKNANNSDKKYFNCTLQCKDGVRRAVCFSQQKHPEIKAFQNTKCAVKILQYSTSKTDDIILNHQSKIIPNEEETRFSYSDDLIPSGVVTSISALNNVASEQVISIKAQVVNISAVKVVKTQYQGTLKKQEILKRDTTSSIKVILWESYAETLTLNSTYLLKNLKVKISRNERYLNTAKDVPFQFTETSPFTQQLVDVNAELASMVASTINGKIIGFLQINNSIGCISCKKKVIPNPDNQDLGKCEDCNLMQIVSSCTTQWFMRILVQSSTNPSEHRRLTLFNKQVEELVTLMNLNLDLNSVTETDISLAILKKNKPIKITFDSHSNKIQTITM
ncbi:PREDICTED: uncharacterized protein LOC107357102 [Acropora digitifera]|uniref:uncharacterized protein LOC107357102 n=1 Tax=Acropora digitifera TaxID=70779 RepID=UPI00077AA2B0|nr:PREDICTED: uncharacterized protein LOC107357102 [Acropora digitifera]